MKEFCKHGKRGANSESLLPVLTSFLLKKFHFLKWIQKSLFSSALVKMEYTYTTQYIRTNKRDKKYINRITIFLQRKEWGYKY